MNPNFEWYSKRSKGAGLSPRCPISSADLCPRYFASIWMLGKDGLITEISEEDEKRLENKWKPFKAVIAEEDVGISRSDEGLRSISGICPEVGFEVFGYFVSHLYKYADEIDHDCAHARLGAKNVESSDFRWRWADVSPRHYTECREYSIFSHLASGKAKKTSNIRTGLPPKLRWQVLARDSFTCQYCGRRPPDVVLEVDHKLSVADGGTADPENLISTCMECNRGKGAKSV